MNFFKTAVFLLSVLFSLHGNTSEGFDGWDEFYLSIEYAPPDFLLSKGVTGKEIHENYKGHHKWFLLFHNLPEDELVVVKLRRLIVLGEELSTAFRVSSTKLQTSQVAEVYGVPGGVIEGIGFFPGEEITFLVENENGELKGEISVTPWPLMSLGKGKEAYIEAKLVNRNLATYAFTFHGFEKGEKLTMTSSQGILMGPRQVTTDDIMFYCPEEVEVPGGIAKVSFKRNNNESFVLNCPWGHMHSMILEGKVAPRPKTFNDVVEFYSSQG